MYTEAKTKTFDKYADHSNFEAERQAAERFEVLKASSSDSLKISSRRVTMAYIAVLCLTLILGVFTYTTSTQSTEDITELYENHMAIRYTAQLMNSNVMEVHVAMRDLALSEDGQDERIEQRINTVERSLVGLGDSYSKLYGLVSHQPEFVKFLDELAGMLDHWAVTRTEAIEFAKAGDMESCRQLVVNVNGMMVDEINGQTRMIVEAAWEMADANYLHILDDQKRNDMYSAVLIASILICGLILLVYIRRLMTGAQKLVGKSQQDQNEILDELIVMDETLRQNLSKLEQEGQVILEIKEKYSNSLEAANDLIMEANIETGEFFTSEKWDDIIGLPRIRTWDTEKILDAIFPEDRSKVKDAFSRVHNKFNVQFRIIDSECEIRWLEVRGKWINQQRMSASISDITAKKQSEQYIEYMAYHDAITHLPNRAMFIRALETELDVARDKDASGAVLFIDLDNFKMINDGQGHDFGDRLLMEVSNKIQQALGKDTLIARFGGDEFLVLLKNVYEQEDVLKHIYKITDTLDEPLVIGNSTLFVTASIGVSIYPDDGDSVSQLLKNSDAAMYESKYAGRNTYSFYNSKLSDRLLRQSAIIDILRNAVNDDLVYMVYQPQYDPSTNRVVSCEALMRLRVDEKLGFIAPDEFIPIAEETRLIIPLGYWVIRQAIETDMELQRQGVHLESVSVNVSDMQLNQTNFVETIKDIIDEYGYDASRLHIEVTESILLNNLNEKIEIFEELRDIGVKIELDDFGTGYSSLNYVRMIPLDALKIDKCFIDEIGISEEKEELIGLMISLARMFGALVIAEGVENAQQLKFLNEKGGVIIQGYYYSKPVDVKELPAKIEELNSLTPQE